MDPRASGEADMQEAWQCCWPSWPKHSVKGNARCGTCTHLESVWASQDPHMTPCELLYPWRAASSVYWAIYRALFRSPFGDLYADGHFRCLHLISYFSCFFPTILKSIQSFSFRELKIFHFIKRRNYVRKCRFLNPKKINFAYIDYFSDIDREVERKCSAEHLIFKQ